MNPDSQQEQRPHKKRGPKRKFDDEFRRKALEQMTTSSNIAELARQLGVRRKWLYYWRDEASGGVSAAKQSADPTPASMPENREKKRLTELERLVARQALEIDFFQRCLAARRGKTAEARTDFRHAVYEQIRPIDGQQGELTIERLCTLASVSRASFYRFCGPPAEADEQVSQLRDAIQRIALESRHYGYRRITHALRAQGWDVNHKRIARLLRQDNLLAIR